jgi:hypothetical protein
LQNQRWKSTLLIKQSKLDDGKKKLLKKLVANSLATKNQLITTKKKGNLFEMFNCQWIDLQH